LAAALIVVLAAGTASAAPAYWAGNGHYYEAVSGLDIGYSWYQADAAAQASSFMGVAGYLATVTSAEENAFITSTFPEAYYGGHWLGGFQPDGSPEPDGGWQWVTGEAWSYTNWAAGEPNNSNFGPEYSHEDGLQFRSDPLLTFGSWNDWLRSRQSLPDANFYPGYVVEYPTPEPATVAFMGLGLAGLWVRRRRK
jgi:hypothetical protein